MLRPGDGAILPVALGLLDHGSPCGLAPLSGCLLQSSQKTFRTKAGFFSFDELDLEFTGHPRLASVLALQVFLGLPDFHFREGAWLDVANDAKSDDGLVLLSRAAPVRITSIVCDPVFPDVVERVIILEVVDILGVALFSTLSTASSMSESVLIGGLAIQLIYSSFNIGLGVFTLRRPSTLVCHQKGSPSN